MTEDEVNTLIETYINNNLDTLLKEYLDENDYASLTAIGGMVDEKIENASLPPQDEINEMVYNYNQTDDGITQIQNICGDYITENYDL